MLTFSPQLLLNDFYLPGKFAPQIGGNGADGSSGTGALVLAHSLRDTGTTRKLAVLYTADSVSTDALAELKVES